MKPALMNLYESVYTIGIFEQRRKLLFTYMHAYIHSPLS
jgi:hypothetical protein